MHQPAAALLLSALLLSGCGSAAQEGIKTMQSSPRRTSAAACATELDTVKTAIAAYEATYGESPARVTDLVETFLRTKPTFYELDASGGLTLSGEGQRAGCPAPT